MLDVKTGSGAFLRKLRGRRVPAALMVTTAEAAGTRTVALLTDMGQPLVQPPATGSNWSEAVDLLRGKRPASRAKQKTCVNSR